MPTFSGVFGVADHGSGTRFALKPHLPDALDQFDEKIVDSQGEVVIFHTRFRGSGGFALDYVRPFKTVTTKKKFMEIEFLSTVLGPIFGGVHKV